VAVVPALELQDVAGVIERPLTGAELSWTLSAITLGGKRPSRAVTALLDLMADAIRPEGTSF
jgi:hypothetical protein